MRTKRLSLTMGADVVDDLKRFCGTRYLESEPDAVRHVLYAALESFTNAELTLAQVDEFALSYAHRRIDSGSALAKGKRGRPRVQPISIRDALKTCRVRGDLYGAWMKVQSLFGSNGLKPIEVRRGLIRSVLVPGIAGEAGVRKALKEWDDTLAAEFRMEPEDGFVNTSLPISDELMDDFVKFCATDWENDVQAAVASLIRRIVAVYMRWPAESRQALVDWVTWYSVNGQSTVVVQP